MLRGVSGSAADHFAPRVAADVLGVLPIDPTRTRVGATLGAVTSGSANLVEGTTEATLDGVSGTVDAAATAVGGTVDGIGTDGALGTATGAVDALTNTATSTTTGVLGGLN